MLPELSVEQARAPHDEFAADEIRSFQHDGYAIARGLAGEDVRREMIDATWHDLRHERQPLEFEADLQYPGAPASRADKGGRTVRRLQKAHARHTVFTGWLMQPSLVARVRQLLGPDIVVPTAHHNCIMTKHPDFSSDTGWHQDIRYWSFERPELVSVWLALGPENARNGCLRVIPGSHRLELDRSRFDEMSFLRDDVPENRSLIDTAVLTELEPGDVLFFHCRTFHSATRNFSDQTKLSVVFTFRPLDNRPLPGTRSTSLPELLIPR